MQPKFDPNKKILKSLLSILDTMEYSKKPSHATVPLKGSAFSYPMPRPKLPIRPRSRPPAPPPPPTDILGCGSGREATTFPLSPPAASLPLQHTIRAHYEIVLRLTRCEARTIAYQYHNHMHIILHLVCEKYRTE
jgi:hypothetical protein